MKKAALIVSGLLVSALACGSVAAETVRVRLTARVTEVSDPQGLLGGKIALGQRMNGTYVYNTNTPNQWPDSNSGQYQPYANEARVRFASGSLVFENVAPTQQILINVQSHEFGSGYFLFDSAENKPLANGASVDFISIQFNGVGTLTESSALPTAAPDLQGYWNKQVRITGGSGFQLGAEIEAAELIVPDAFEVTPASGNFIPGQQFDAALILPRNSNVASAEASVNGIPLFNYPGNCELLPPNSARKPSLLCQSADSVLVTAHGEPIEWNVVLTNGTTLTQTVTWTLAQ